MIMAVQYDYIVQHMMVKFLSTHGDIPHSYTKYTTTIRLKRYWNCTLCEAPCQGIYEKMKEKLNYVQKSVATFIQK